MSRGWDSLSCLVWSSALLWVFGWRPHSRYRRRSVRSSASWWATSYPARCLEGSSRSGSDASHIRHVRAIQAGRARNTAKRPSSRAVGCDYSRMSIEAAAEFQPKWRRIGRLLAVLALIAALFAATSDMSGWRAPAVGGIALIAVGWLLWDVRRSWRPLVTEQGGAIIAGGLSLRCSPMSLGSSCLA